MENPFETINARLSNIESLLLDLKHRPEHPKELQLNNRIGGIELAEQITGKARSTIYNLVSAGEIPVAGKRGQKLYFSEADLREWISQPRTISSTEIRAEVNLSLGKHRRKKTIPKKKNISDNQSYK